MDQVREKLLTERAAIVTALETNDHKPVELDQTAVGRLTRMDAMQAQALAQNVRRRRQQRVMAIAKALLRIDEDEYGYCLSCADTMDPKRLEIDATAEYCVACAEKEGL
ncbi:MAG: TraR/DksA family transcriptional regulator [Pseudomonadales bacterium]|jgi:DnaK suppressor protein|nr:TraR/DksA family transcriptional regulator [Pseudomonadales bacterium]